MSKAKIKWSVKVNYDRNPVDFFGLSLAEKRRIVYKADEEYMKGFAARNGVEIEIKSIQKENGIE